MKADELTYFDHNATTPLDPRVRDAMLPWFGGLHGNPSSAHAAGRQARQAIEAARQQVATLLGGEASEIVFVSSGSEANNTVIYTLARRCGFRGHLITSTLEHPSVRVAAQRMAEEGMDVTELRPGADGRVTAASVRDALRPDTRLVCLMLANNELGTLQPVAEVAAICREHGVPVLSDAVQAISKIPVDARALGVDYLVLGGHKFHGPAGIAALWVRSGAELDALLVGAAQEAQRRASTENVPAIVGLGEAAALAEAEQASRYRQLLTLRERFETGLAGIPGTVVHCAEVERLPHTSHVAFLGLSGHELMLQLDRAGFAVSTGSACHSGQPQPSAALVAMGVAESEALASLRISFGITNTPQEIDRFLEVLVPIVESLRAAPSAVAV
ncbi:MAG: cysteine desulfurase family protein [Acidobacteriota bacterium]